MHLPSTQPLLIKLGGLNPNATTATIATLAACCKALRKDSFRVLSEVLAAFISLSANHTVLPFPSHITDAFLQPSTNPPGIHMQTPFPTTLPECQLPANYKKRHALLAKHKRRLMNRVINIQTAVSRVSQLVHNSLSAGSQHPCIQVQELGQAHLAVPGSLSGVPSSQLAQPAAVFKDTPDCKLCQLHIAAKHNPDYISNFLSTAVLVLKWWKPRLKGSIPALMKA